jgi:hypothetical protein
MLQVDRHQVLLLATIEAMLALHTIDQLQVQVITEVAPAHRVEVARVHQTTTLLAEVALADQPSALLAVAVSGHQATALLAEVQEEALVVPLEVAPRGGADQEGGINSPFFLVI